MEKATPSELGHIVKRIASEFDAALVGKLSIRFAFFEWLGGTDGPGEELLLQLPVFSDCHLFKAGWRRTELSCKKWTHRQGKDWAYYYFVPETEWSSSSQVLLDKFSDLYSKANWALDMLEGLRSPRIATAPRGLKLIAAFLDTLQPVYYGLLNFPDGQKIWAFNEMGKTPHTAGAWVTDNFARHAAESLRYVVDSCMPGGNKKRPGRPKSATVEARQKKVVALVLDGKSRGAIAAQLGVSPDTVSKDIKRVKSGQK